MFTNAIYPWLDACITNIFEMMDKSIEKTINNTMNRGGTEYSWIPLKVILFSSSRYCWRDVVFWKRNCRWHFHCVEDGLRKGDQEGSEDSLELISEGGRGKFRSNWIYTAIPAATIWNLNYNKTFVMCFLQHNEKFIAQAPFTQLFQTITFSLNKM